MQRMTMFAAMGAALLTLAACGDEAEVVDVPEEADLAEACISDDAVGALGDIMFESAAEMHPDDPAEIMGMREVSDISLTMAVLDEVDEETKRINCSARMVVAIPEQYQGQFGGLEELKSDIGYSIQESADGDSFVVELTEGMDDAVAAIIVAFVGEGGELLSGEEEAAPAPQVAKTYNPSFSCKGRLSFSEKTICEDPQLSELDRRMQDAYLTALSYAGTAAEERAIERRQREWIAERDSCANNTGYECYVDSYNARFGELTE